MQGTGVGGCLMIHRGQSCSPDPVIASKRERKMEVKSSTAQSPRGEARIISTSLTQPWPSSKNMFGPMVYFPVHGTTDFAEQKRLYLALDEEECVFQS